MNRRSETSGVCGRNVVCPSPPVNAHSPPGGVGAQHAPEHTHRTLGFWCATAYVLTKTVHPEVTMQISQAERDRLAATIDSVFEERATITARTTGRARDAVEKALGLLDRGVLRVAEPTPSGWKVNQWLKKAVLLSFRLTPMEAIPGGPGEGTWWDKVPSKFDGWSEIEFEQAGFRAVPGCIVRRSAHIAPGVVLMPSFVNLGAYVDEGTMIDTWATVGSCAQIGKNCHISGGTGIGGVLEPLQADPVIVEDDCFIGARSEVAEGVRVGRGSVISMGVFLGASTKVIDRATGETFRGEVPPYSVVVPGSVATKSATNEAIALSAAIIVKRVDERTRAKTSINDLLRD